MRLVTNIYGLFDPRSPDVIMYVGKGLAKRAAHHWLEFIKKGTAENARERKWFEKILNDGIVPGWRFLEENVVDWIEAEKRWILFWRQINPNLCNVLGGGNEWPLEAGKLGAEVIHQLYPELVKKWVSKAGKIGGRKGALRMHELHPEIAKESGFRIHKLYPNLASETMSRTHELNPNLARESGKIGGPIANHNRWHIKRNKPNPICQLCRPEFFDLWESNNAS